MRFMSHGYFTINADSFAEDSILRLAEKVLNYPVDRNVSSFDHGLAWQPV